MRRNPKISVITVVLNAARDLEKTLESTIGQDYPGLEIIIIDGGSVDGTLAVIKRFANRINYWISEPDGGIYDAMNKGLARATGDWVNFMNAGDVFYNKRVLSSVFSRDHGDAGVIYGDSIASYPGFRAFRKAGTPADLWKGMICCHQSVFVRTKLVRHDGFRHNQYFSADYEMMVRLQSAGVMFSYIPATVSVFDTRGISNRYMARSARSNLEIIGVYRVLTEGEKSCHRRIIRIAQITEMLYKCLPAAVTRLLLRQLYRNQVINKEIRR